MVIGSTGNTTSAATNTANVTYTVGEVVINTITSPNKDLTQGFHQPTLKVLSISSFEEKLNINLFPNPTKDFVQFTSDKNVNITVNDISGKTLYSETNVNQKTIDLSEYERGVYFVTVYRNNKTIGTYKIIKS